MDISRAGCCVQAASISGLVKTEPKTMKVTINGKGPFYEVPYCCGDCKCGINSNMRQAGGHTHCSLFGLTKRYYDHPPKRCREMFEKALAIGGDVVLVKKEQ